MQCLQPIHKILEAIRSGSWAVSNSDPRYNRLPSTKYRPAAWRVQTEVITVRARGRSADNGFGRHMAANGCRGCMGDGQALADGRPQGGDQSVTAAPWRHCLALSTTHRCALRVGGLCAADARVQLCAAIRAYMPCSLNPANRAPVAHFTAASRTSGTRAYSTPTSRLNSGTAYAQLFLPYPHHKQKRHLRGGVNL